jgi:hypothetical protein
MHQSVCDEKPEGRCVAGDRKRDRREDKGLVWQLAIDN